MDFTPEALRLARQRLGLNQANMADALGMSQPNYCKIENGKYGEIPDELKARIEVILGRVTPDSGLDKISELERDVGFLKRELDLVKALLHGLVKRGGGVQAQAQGASSSSKGGGGLA